MSKFKDLMAQARQRETQPQDPEEAPDTTSVETPIESKAKPAKKGAAPAASATQTTTENGETVSRGRGRPSGPSGGKRSHPDYEQVSAYLPRQTYRQVKLALLQNEMTSGEKQEFSALVEELLAAWLQNRNFM